MASISSHNRCTIPACVFCLELRDNDRRIQQSDSRVISQFLQFTTAYLKIECGENLLQAHQEKIQCLLSFCEECEHKVEGILKIYRQLEELKCKLAWKMTAVGEIINRSQRKLETERDDGLTLPPEVNVVSLPEFRKQVARKCELVAEKILPNVIITKSKVVVVASSGNSSQSGLNVDMTDSIKNAHSDTLPHPLQDAYNFQISKDTNQPESLAEKIEVDIPSPACSMVSLKFDGDDDDGVADDVCLSSQKKSPNRSVENKSNLNAVENTKGSKRKRKARNGGTDKHQQQQKPKKFIPEPSCQHFRRIMKTSRSAQKAKRTDTSGDTEPHSYSIKCTNTLYCSKSFRRLFQFQEHSRQEHVNNTTAAEEEQEQEDNQACDICLKQYKSNLELLSHLEENHDDPDNRIFACCYCHKSFCSEQWVNLHRRDTHWFYPQEFHCEIHDCSKKFTLAKELQEHYKTSHFSTTNSTTNPTVFSCDKCHWPFLSKHRLLLHEFSHYVPNSSQNGFQCPKCPNQYRTTMKLAGHFNIAVVQYHCNPADKLTFWNCDAHTNCDFHFYSEKELNAHKEIHGLYPLASNYKRMYLSRKRFDSRRYGVCLYCLEKFPTQTLRIEHESSCVSKPSGSGGEQPGGQLVCEMCGYSTPRRGVMQKHKRHHLKLFEVECPHCGIKYSGKHHLRMHILKVHLKQEKKFVCDLCGVKRLTEVELKYHKVQHEKKHMCQECGETFPRVGMLHVHVRKHTGERLQCWWCPKVYMEVSGLKYHYKHGHAEEYQKWYADNRRRRLIHRKVKIEQQEQVSSSSKVKGKKKKNKNE